MFLFSVFKKQYLPLNTIEVSQNALLRNYAYLSRLNKSIQIAPVLKSNAYGHGLEIVAKILDVERPPFFCVDSIYEGYKLLKLHIKTPILIMGYIDPENLKVKKLPFSYAVFDPIQVEVIKKYQPHAGIHIFVDTGMHREGVSLEELPSLLESAKSLRIEGLMSHLAAGENKEITNKQLSEFAKARKIVFNAGVTPQWIHIAASSCLLNHESYGDIGNIARAGIAIYGIDPESKNNQLQPALQLNATLSQIKRVKKGDKMGYDHTFTANHEMKIGILSAGYNDGIDRRLSNKGCVIVNGKVCPIIGRVSMNLTTIDISNVHTPKVGERVIVFSAQPDAINSLSNAAIQSSTIAYELLVKMASTTRRSIVSHF